MLLIYIAVYCQRFLSKNPVSGIAFTMLGLVIFLKLISYMQVNTEILHLLQRIASLGKS